MLGDNSVRKIGANLKFDLTWCIDRTGVAYARNIKDIMIESQLVNDYRTADGARKAGMPGAWVPNNLQAILQRTLGVKISKSVQHEDVYEKLTRNQIKQGMVPKLISKGVDWLGPWTVEMEDYMLEDIEYLEPAHEELERFLIEDGQERAAWIENNSVFAVAWMTYAGILPDVEAWKRFIQQQTDQHHEMLGALRPLFPTVGNFASPLQLKPGIEKALGISIPNCRKETLKMLAPQFPSIQALQDQRHLQTRVKNWGLGFLARYVCPICGRFHPDWRQIGAETARASCSSPNLQQIPRESDYRKLFIASPGHVIASLDYTAIEVLTAAIFAEEKNLLKACETGDPHAATAAMVNGMTDKQFAKLEKTDPVKWKELRQGAKIANFGLLFGGGADGLVAQARDIFNVHMSREQAVAMIEKYFKLYPKLRNTKNMAYNMLRSPEQKLDIRNLIGFRRYLEGHNRKPTSILNTIIQSSAGHGMKSAYRHLMEAGLLPFLCVQVHDELLFEFPEDPKVHKPMVAKAKACLIAGMREVLGANAPVMVDDSAVGRTWA